MEFDLFPIWFHPLLLFTILIRLIIQSHKIAKHPNLRSVPGPFFSAYSSLPLQIAILRGRRTVYIHALHEKYGPYVRIGPQEIAIADIEAHRVIHRVGSDYNKGSWYQGQVPTLHTDAPSGIFCIMNNKDASHRRRVLQKAGPMKVVLEWEPHVIALTGLAARNIKYELEKYGFSDVMKQWTVMSAEILNLAFGQSSGDTEEEGKNHVPHAVGPMMPMISMRDDWPWTRFFFETLPSWCPSGLTSVWNRFARGEKGAERATHSKTLFSKMVRSAQHPNGAATQQEADALAAGTDNTAITLTYLVYTVLKHEDVKLKLIEALATLPRNPSSSQLEALPHLQNVIQEVLRLHPVVPGSLPRIVPEGGGRLGPYVFPGGIQVSTQAWTMQRDARVFADPLKYPNPLPYSYLTAVANHRRFDPDRWNDPTPAMREHMLVFGGSARSCLSKDIARVSLAHAVAALFRECPRIGLGAETTEESMEMVDYFAVKPRGRRCVVVPVDRE
ncbi:cytochrome P450 [Boeremia exigua]|uniref:cytochrome P450 n=1 Tax=Boeremia exigua TaxID=749465 RepID=UPI001E8CD7FB|nr:cytochrome P450 [Boeremia exigua]KAH6625608.1 cytochrome P450 [Boeremia exigua]